MYPQGVKYAIKSRQNTNPTRSVLEKLEQPVSETKTSDFLGCSSSEVITLLSELQMEHFICMLIIDEGYEMMEFN